MVKYTRSPKAKRVYDPKDPYRFCYEHITPEAEAEFYRGIGDGPVAFTRPTAAPAAAGATPPAEQKPPPAKPRPAQRAKKAGKALKGNDPASALNVLTNGLIGAASVFEITPQGRRATVITPEVTNTERNLTDQ